MVDCGRVAPWTCPNEVGCEHGITQHRYEPDRERWVCTVEECLENPYRVVRISDLSGRLLNAEAYNSRMRALREIHGPEVTFEFVVEAPPFSPDLDLLSPATARWWRRKRLGLHWWQREGR